MRSAWSQESAVTQLRREIRRLQTKDQLQIDQVQTLAQLLERYCCSDTLPAFYLNNC